MAIARERNVTVILNPSPVQPGTAELVRMADVVVLNETEIRAMGFSSALAASASWDAAVLLTLGPYGADLAYEGREVHVPSPPTTAVDTSGARDAALAAFSVALAEGASYEDAARRAVQAGTLAVRKAGARSSVRRDQLDNALSESKS